MRDRMIHAANASLRRLEGWRRPAEPLAKARNFLIPQHHRALGAAVCSTPLISVLKAAIPGARIAIAASGFSLETFAQNPGVDRLEPSPDPREDLRGAVRALRGARFFAGEPFVTILTIGNARGDFKIAALLSGSRQCLDYAIRPQPGTSLAYDLKLSRSANDLRFLQLLGHGPALAEVLRREPELQHPRIFVTPHEIAAARALLQEQGIVEGKPFAIFIVQGRPEPVRYWPREYFCATAEWLYREFGVAIVFVGAAGDASAIDSIRAPLDVPSVNLAGRTSIRTLAALGELAAVGVSFDTGAMHVMRAVGLPQVVIAPAHGAPVEWLPLGDPRARVLYSAYAAPGCGYPVPGEVSVQEVQSAVRDLLQRYRRA